MKHRLTPRAWKRFEQKPAPFMMHCALRRALRQTKQFRRDAKGLMICIVDKGWIWHAKSAAITLMSGDADGFIIDDEFRGAVLVIDDIKRRTRRDEPIPVIRPDHQGIILVSSLDLVPLSLRLAADVVVEVQSPNGRHFNASRRIGGSSVVSPELAEEIARQGAEIVIGLAARESLDKLDISLLTEPLDEPHRSPRLSELPGFRSARPWILDLKADVAGWEAATIPWRDVGKAILLCGPTGVGKTFFATALASELGWDLIATSVGEWQGSKEGHLGHTLGAMTRSFAAAGSRKGCVLFIDELDAIGDRAKMRDDHIYYEANIINRFLELVSELCLKEGVVLVGATNYPHLIDSAILRSGRIETHIYLELPDDEERAEILAYHLEGALSAGSLRSVTDDLRLITPADIERLARDAKRMARLRMSEIEIKDVRDALPAREPLPEEVVRRIAVHECGHALVAMNSGHAEVVRIRIETHFVAGMPVQDGGRIHYRMLEPVLPTEKQLLAKIRILLAGTAAEEVVFGSRSIGAGGVIGSDLDQATRLAYRMVASYGLGKSLRFQAEASSIDESFRPIPEHRTEVEGILAREYRTTKELLAKQKAALMQFSAELVVARDITIEK